MALPTVCIYSALPTVCIYSASHEDGPRHMVRAPTTAEIAQREGINEHVLVNGENAV
ncbi:hypothetical protein [Streptomyces sp. NBC_01483]|uniref:hypothetical protein n=1 Tax=Streptomyces sp. NBC_01483 TaxID=2903883 RepID=UPI002E356651|nr:hypothetical protein [Streptomyces sp. NBC_01483]